MAPEGRTTLLALLDDVDAGRAHAFCARPVRHTAGILMSAWDACGPPPPPESNEGEGAEIWNRVERAAFERGCASCAAAYERCLDHWDEAVDAGDEDDVGAILSALLRERLEGRAALRIGNGSLKPSGRNLREAERSAAARDAAFLADLEAAEAEARAREPSSRGIRDRLAPPRGAPANDRRRVAGFVSDPLDAWNGDRGGFASYPSGERDIEPGDAETVFDPSEGVDVIDLSVGTFGKAAIPPPVSATSGLGEAVGDGMRWRDTSTAPWGQSSEPAADTRSPYERAVARARARAPAKHAALPLRTDADILAGARRPGGPTHRSGVKSQRAGARGGYADGVGSGFANAVSAAIRADAATIARDQLNLDAQLRERSALAQKREAERAAAKAAREARVAERQNRVIDLDVEDGSLASAAESRREANVRLLSPGSEPARARTIARMAALRGRASVVPKRPEPPWQPPRLQDVVAATLRWSLSHVASTSPDADFFSNATEGDGSSSFATPRAYVEMFVPSLLAELRAQIASELKNAEDDPSGSEHASTRATIESFFEGSREGGRGGSSAYNVGASSSGSSFDEIAKFALAGGRHVDAFAEHDFVLVQKAPGPGAPPPNTATTSDRPHAFGWVETIDRGGSGSDPSGRNVSASVGLSSSGAGTRLRVRLCLAETPSATTRWLTGHGGGPLETAEERHRRSAVAQSLRRRDAAFTLTRITGVTPTLRELAATLAVGTLSAKSTVLCDANGAKDTSIASTLDRSVRTDVGKASSEAALAPAPPKNVDVRAWRDATTGLNGPQRGALRAVAESMRRGATNVVLVQGPPGTGKTHTIAAAVDIIVSAAKNPALSSGAAPKSPRVLVCAQSNSAVDELVVRLARGGRRKLTRLGREEATRADAVPFLATRLAADDCSRDDPRPSTVKGKHATAARSCLARRDELNTKLTELDAALLEHSKKSARDRGCVDISLINARRDVIQDAQRENETELEGLMGKLSEKEREAFKRATGGSEADASSVDVMSYTPWARVVAEAEVVCATLSGAGQIAADRTGSKSGGQGKKMKVGKKAAAGIASLSPFSAGSSTTCVVPLFDAVVIDEAAQATEPATLIPLRWLKPGGTIVLVGDPKQLAPTVLCRGGHAKRLALSLFERLQRRGAAVHLLSVQYRMHPSIREFPSERFYGGRLTDGESAFGRRASPLGATYAFIDVSDGFERRRGEGGISNPVEAEAALEAYMEILSRAEKENRLLGEGRDGSDAAVKRRKQSAFTVGVVSPYRDQLAELRRRFARVATSQRAVAYAPVEFATVDGVQGREFDVVIVSCARRARGDDLREQAERAKRAGDAEMVAFSRRTVGFLADERRMNVALTRPKLGLVVFGHGDTLRADEAWNALLNDADRRGLLASVTRGGAGFGIRRALEAVFSRSSQRVSDGGADPTGGGVVIDLLSDDDELEPIGTSVGGRKRRR